LSPLSWVWPWFGVTFRMATFRDILQSSISLYHVTITIICCFRIVCLEPMKRHKVNCCKQTKYSGKTSTSIGGKMVNYSRPGVQPKKRACLFAKRNLLSWNLLYGMMALIHTWDASDSRWTCRFVHGRCDFLLFTILSVPFYRVLLRTGALRSYPSHVKCLNFSFEIPLTLPGTVNLWLLWIFGRCRYFYRAWIWSSACDLLLVQL
jgi:hypothetical protein